MIPPEILGRAVGEDSAVANKRSMTSPSIAITVPYNSGVVGTAHVQLFVSNDDEDRGGYVVRLTIEDGGGSFAPLGKNVDNGVELHLAGEAEGAALLAALSGLLVSFQATANRRGVGV